MSALHITTPLLKHGPLLAMPGKHVVLKMENLQQSETACGTTLAVAYQQLPHLKEFHVPLIVVCGGIGVDLAKLEAWKNHFEL